MSAGEEQAALELDSYRHSHPQVVRLARVASLAVRIEPFLLRRLRQELLPDLDVGVEADVWFSPLVESRGTEAIVLDADVAAVLRTSLAGDRPLLRRALDITHEAHRHVAPSLQLEETVNGLALLDGEGAIDDIDEALRPALRTLRQGGERAGEVAHWAMRAFARFHPAVLRSQSAQSLRLAASVVLGGRRLVNEMPQLKMSLRDIGWVLPAEALADRVPMGIELMERGVRFTAPRSGRPGIELPRTDPLLVELNWSRGSERFELIVEAIPDSTVDLQDDVSELMLRTLAGDEYMLASETAADDEALQSENRPVVEAPSSDIPEDQKGTSEDGAPEAGTPQSDADADGVEARHPPEIDIPESEAVPPEPEMREQAGVEGRGARRTEFVVYLSSTVSDLQPEREIALKTISEFAIVKTSYRATEDGAVAACLDEVAKSDLYVGILGQRYGYVPPTSESNPENKSITELEYQRCDVPGQLRIPRLMFLKSIEAGATKAQIDALSHPETAERIKQFRIRASQDQTTYQYRNIDDFRAELRIRVKEKADEFHRQSAGDTMLSGSSDWKRQLVPVVIACVPGNDETSREAIQGSGSNRFVAIDLSPDDPDYLATLDAGLQKAQIGCLLITRASIARLSTDSAVAKVADAIALLQRRTGHAFLLCEGVSPATLPHEWSTAKPIELANQRLTGAAVPVLEKIYDRLRIDVPSLSVDPRLALPYIVLAPTQSEAESLATDEAKSFSRFKSDVERDLRQREFDRIAHTAHLVDPQWPHDFYAAERHRWKCFGAGSPTADELVLRSVRRINEAAAGSRERRFLRSAKLIPRRYDFDEYLNDPLGSRRTIEQIRENGCLIVVDEIALLHPYLRAAADALLSSNKIAIIAIAPPNRGHISFDDDFSYLRVGSLVSRFKDEDPRCEIAGDSRERVERWLRITIPELIAGAEEIENSPELIAAAQALFR